MGVRMIVYRTLTGYRWEAQLLPLAKYPDVASWTATFRTRYAARKSANDFVDAMLREFRDRVTGVRPRRRRR